MTYRTVRVAALATVALGLALTQQACASGVTVSTSPATTAPTAGGSAPAAPAASHSAQAGQTGSAKTGQTGSGKTGGSGQGGSTVAVCRTKDMTAVVTFQPQSVTGATRKGLVTLTNTSHRACKVEGRAAISLTNAADEVVDAAVENVDEPGKATPIVLKPGRTAFEGIKWTVCDKSDEHCAVGNGMKFNLEASTDGLNAKLEGFPAAEKSNITMRAMSIGTLQPSTQGVVAW
ncbi:DUF4232 domain-containing protein [Krasilnikovia sp. MM14-A1259]|uniref:DUF4232 domain-containing protein n=1 Tax=Krasilnikovia sp. MM14-A1259 TaxID=3373539 RepID=UPI0037F8DEA2